MKKFVKALVCVLALAFVLGMAAAAEPTGTITWVSDDTVFTADDLWAQGWIQTWGGTVTITGVDVLGKGGEVLGSGNDFMDAQGVVVLFGTDEATEEPNGFLNSNGYEITDFYGLKYYVTYAQEELDDEEFWIGGGIGVNSTSTGWSSTEWGKASGEKPIALEDGLDAAGSDDTPADDTPADDTPADDTPAQDNTPSTGDATSIALLSVVAIIALGGVVVSSKKRA